MEQHSPLMFPINDKMWCPLTNLRLIQKKKKWSGRKTNAKALDKGDVFLFFFTDLIMYSTAICLTGI